MVLLAAPGVDPERAGAWAETAAQWLRGAVPHDASSASFDDATPHPLDTPTDEQGIALAALDSGRWSIEPGTSALVAGSEGPAPTDGLGLVRALRARDWLRADGTVTVAGLHALERWLARD